MNISASKEMRIDQYLNEVLDYSRSKIEKMIKEGHVLVNNNKIKKKKVIN